MPKPRRTRYDAPLDNQTPTKPRPVQILSCPVCDVLLGKQRIDEHMAAHRPVPHDCTKHEAWQLDLDAVLHYRADVNPWYCKPCGKYAPVAVPS